MKIAIAGGSGFVGQAVSEFFVSQGAEVFILTRKGGNDSNLKQIEWLTATSNPSSQLAGVDVLINLAGESINSGRWTEQRKARILQSRLTATNEILKIIEITKPKLLINASAIGFYGTSDHQVFTEESASIGNDFLAETVKQWEALALKANQFGVRTALCRFGIVLAKNGGALPKMSLPYRMLIGGKLGKGNQWVSWIHLEDVVRAIDFIIKNERLHGPINFISPNPVTMNEFGKTLGAVLKSPHWLPLPGFVMKLALGEMSILMLEGQKVIPKKLLQYQFEFRYPNLELALKNIFQN
ncbi:TIGR01777 family oxidoreductase [Pseudoneobacillus sp. C159]